MNMVASRDCLPTCLSVSCLATDVKVAFELRQVADVYLGGTLMAYFDSNGRDFFYPWASTLPRIEKDRELIMERTIDFPVIFFVLIQYFLTRLGSSLVELFWSLI